MLEAERILMMDFTSTQTQAKEAAPPASREGGQDEAIAIKHLGASPPITANRVDKMYHQLAEIRTIPATQLVECSRWL
jgi:hypothetical protein